MRIGLVTGEFPPLQGGVGDYTHELACALSGQSAEIHVITDARCADFHPSREAFILHPSIRRWSFPALFTIRSLAHSLNLDILSLQYQAAAYGLGAPIHFLPDVAAIRTVVTFHDLRIPYLFPKAGRLRDWAVTHLAQAARGAITTNAGDEAELRRRGVQHVTTIPIGSNIAPQPPDGYNRDEWRARMGLHPDEFLLGYFGFLNPSKGGDVLIQMLAALLDRKAKVRLALIGGQTGASDPANEQFSLEIEQLIKRYDLTHHILRTGFIEPRAASAYLLACDAMVLPYHDGASLRRGTLMAALAHGCAIVSTQPTQPVPELRDGDNIRLVPAGSVSALVLAVTELLHAPELRARMGQRARELSQQFSWDAIAARTLAFFDRCR
jgi:glycosyltransferase involved in cell wall biosynthesis